MESPADRIEGVCLRLQDLSDHNLRVLAALRDLRTAARGHIAERTGLSPQQCSGALNRLAAFGYSAPPEVTGMGWSITPDGEALFGTSEKAKQEKEEWPTDMEKLKAEVDELKRQRLRQRYSGAEDTAWLLRALAEHHAETRMIAAELERLACWLEAA